MILRGTPATISVTYYDGDTVADPGVVTVSVARDDGTELVASTAATGTGASARTSVLTTTHTAQVDVLTATWVSGSHGIGVTYHPIVGGFYVAMATLRGAGDLSNESKFPDTELADARRWWADLVDDVCGRSFVPIYRSERHRRRPGRPLILQRPDVREVLSATVVTAGVSSSVDTSGWVVGDWGDVEDTAGTVPTEGLLTVRYEHGKLYPDQRLYEVGVLAIRGKLLADRTGRPSRSLIISNEHGTTRESRPGGGRATGYPEVDAVLADRARILA